MTEINIKADCGNSPRKQFLKELNIAFAKGNPDFIIDVCAGIDKTTTTVKTVEAAYTTKLPLEEVVKMLEEL